MTEERTEISYSELKSPKLQLETLLNSPNIATLLSKDYLDALGKNIVIDVMRDRGTRAEWEQRHAEAIKLALQVKEVKDFPWTNCSNVKFPSLTIAVLQFLARISIMTKGRNLAKVEHIGGDRTGEKALRAKRISRHISLQLTEEDSNWRDSDEQMKFSACLVGSAFKRTTPNLVKGKTISEHVPAMNLIMDYKTKDLDTAWRVTELVPMTENDIQSEVRRGLYLPMDSEAMAVIPSEEYLLQQTQAQAEGIYPKSGDTSDTYEILHHYCWLDLDGDGYKEPYIVHVRHDTGQVLRVVVRFDDTPEMVQRKNDLAIHQLEVNLDKLKTGAQSQEVLQAQSRLERQIEKLRNAPDNGIVSIQPMRYFTRFLFLPSPDGGIYGLGLGALLGPLNAAIDTLFNQLIDAGTMSNTAGGFLGRGAKLKAGKLSFDPFEWKPVDVGGSGLRDNIFPLPVREPSPVLFQLLSLMILYSEKLSGATDIMTGVSPGQNTPAETSRVTVEQGMMLFSGIYNRMYRGFQEELRKIYHINQMFFRFYPSYERLTSGPEALLMPDDYTAGQYYVFPAASPEEVSKSQRREKAGMVLQLSERMSGFDEFLVVRDLLEALDVENAEQIYPDPKGPHAIPPKPNPKLMEIQLQAQRHQDTMKLEYMRLQGDLRLEEAKIAELEAKAAMEMAKADGERVGKEIALLDVQIGAAKTHKEGLIAALEHFRKSIETAGQLQNQARALDIQRAKQGTQNGQQTANAAGTGGMGPPSGNTGQIG